MSESFTYPSQNCCYQLPFYSFARSLLFPLACICSHMKNITFETSLTPASSFSCFMYNFLLLSALLSCTMISRQFLLTFQMLEQMNLKNYPLSQGSTEAITVELPFSDFFFFCMISHTILVILQTIAIYQQSSLYCHETNLMYSTPLFRNTQTNLVNDCNINNTTYLWLTKSDVSSLHIRHFVLFLKSHFYVLSPLKICAIILLHIPFVTSNTWHFWFL